MFVLNRNVAHFKYDIPELAVLKAQDHKALVSSMLIDKWIIIQSI